MKQIVVMFLIHLSTLFPSLVFAEEVNQFITIVNPVRISVYNPDPLASLLTQYEQIKNRDLPFLPGDLNLKQIYANANVEIWEVAK